jgi:hypothetical protein
MACEPVERRPTIRAWRPRGFCASAGQDCVGEALDRRHHDAVFGTTVVQPPLSGDDVLYWRSEIF